MGHSTKTKQIGQSVRERDTFIELRTSKISHADCPFETHQFINQGHPHCNYWAIPKQPQFTQFGLRYMSNTSTPATHIGMNCPNLVSKRLCLKWHLP